MRSSRRLVATCLTAGILALTITLTTAQTTLPQTPIIPGSPRSPQGQPVPVFRARVDLIQVDVSVLDRDRRPVHGLTAKDFTVFEDGTPQPISAFAEMTASDPDAPADSWMRTVVPDVKVNNAEDGRVLLLILDDARTSVFPATLRGGRPVGPDPTTAVKQVARGIIERMGPADLVAVIFTVKNKNEQEFTSDRNRLFAAIDGFDPVAGNVYNVMRAYDTYKDAAKFLASIPQRRKAIILISPSAPGVLPLDVPATAMMVPTLAEPVLLDGRTRAGPGPDMSDVKIDGMKQQILEEALRGNVSFYNVNPMTMNGLDAEVARLLAPETAQTDRSAARFGAPTSGPPPTPKYYADVTRTSLDQLTGGFSIRRPEEFADGITQIFRETGSYYLLGYTNPDAKDNGRFRKTEVRVNRPELSVRSRAGYYAPKKNDATKYISPMWNAISGLLPAKDIPMRINVATFAIPGKKEVALVIAVGLREPLPVGTTASVPEVVQFLTQAYSTNGDRKGPAQVTTAELQLHPNPRGEVKYEVLSLLTLKPGRYHLRLSATSRVQAKSGSIYYDLEVPDYSKAALSLSGVVVSTTPPLVAGPKEALAKVLPVVPTTQREFQGHRGSAYMRIYQGGKGPIAPVQMTVRIVDTNDAAVFKRDEAVQPERFDSNRAAEYRFELPVGTLGPGAYLLTFEATTPGAPAVREDVRFVVYPPAAAGPPS